MPQPRDLIPITVYVPPAAKAEADRRAAEKVIATSTLLRLILLGQETPLATRG